MRLPAAPAPKPGTSAQRPRLAPSGPVYPGAPPGASPSFCFRKLLYTMGVGRDSEGGTFGDLWVVGVQGHDLVRGARHLPLSSSRGKEVPLIASVLN